MEFCRRCEGFFWNGHTPTCAVPAPFPSLERHHQECVIGRDFRPDYEFDPSKVIC
jgi:hypothetical protein